MYVILGLSIYVGAVIIFKSYQLWKLKVNKTAFVDQVFSHLANKDMKSALSSATVSSHPAARIIETSLLMLVRQDCSESRLKDEMERVGNAEIRYLDMHMRGLEMAANVGPLLGLLGTVMGMVMTFATLEQAGARVNPALLAGGIWVSLLTTVFGLVAAIPALAAHYFFDGQIEKVRALMSDISTRLLSLHGKVRLTSPSVSKPLSPQPGISIGATQSSTAPPIVQ